MKTLGDWKKTFDAYAMSLYPPTDPSHDILHIRRVVATAEKLAAQEKADLNIVLPAAYLHDCVNVPKNDPRRKQASRLSAEAAVEYLRGVDYPAQYYDAIAHAIVAHSFSANIAPETIEAKVVQDADRLDGLGAIGLARMFTVSGLLARPYYSDEDPFAQSRTPDDTRFSIDHIRVKLEKTAATMQTQAARDEARRRIAVMHDYLVQLKSEIAA